MAEIQTVGSRPFDAISKDLDAAERELWKLIKHSNEQGESTRVGKFIEFLRGSKNKLTPSERIEKEIEIREKLSRILQEIKNEKYALNLLHWYIDEGTKIDKLYGVSLDSLVGKLNVKIDVVPPYGVFTGVADPMRTSYIWPIDNVRPIDDEHNSEIASELLEKIINANTQRMENLHELYLSHLLRNPPSDR
ncbi:MAG: hypothetical protein QW774_03270 [Candidatus Micrarchaeaceae archaeon]